MRKQRSQLPTSGEILVMSLWLSCTRGTICALCVAAGADQKIVTMWGMGYASPMSSTVAMILKAALDKWLASLLFA